MSASRPRLEIPRDSTSTPVDWELTESLEVEDEVDFADSPRSTGPSRRIKTSNMSSPQYHRLDHDGTTTVRRKRHTILKKKCFLSTIAALGIVTCIFVTIAITTQMFEGPSIYPLSVFSRLPEWSHSGDRLSATIPQGSNHYPTDITRDIFPIRCHSHNDYWRNAPLLEALHYGCIGVEADIWLRSEDLWVGHNTASLTRARTFKNLYIRPLLDLLNKQNPISDFYFAAGRRHGVYDVDPEQTLVMLVDFKHHSRELWPVLMEQLETLRKRKYLSYANATHFIPGPITVVGTGQVPFDMILSSEQRDIFFDAPLDKLEQGFVPVIESGMSNKRSKKARAASEKRGPASSSTMSTAAVAQFNSTNSYYASVDFSKAIGPVLRGKLSDKQLTKIRAHVKAAADRGLKSRYWGAPAWPISTRNHVWRTLMELGVDILNVDDLPSAALLEW